MNYRRLTSIAVALGIVVAALWFLVEPGRKAINVRELDVVVLAVAHPRNPNGEDWLAVATVELVGEGRAKLFVRSPYPKVGTRLAVTVADYDNGERVITARATRPSR